VDRVRELELCPERIFLRLSFCETTRLAVQACEVGLNVLRQSSFQIDCQSRKSHFGWLPRPENSARFEPNVPILIVESRIDGHFVKLLLDTSIISCKLIH